MDRVVIDQEIMTTTDFRIGLELDLCVASTILKYAKEDIPAISSGQLCIPEPLEDQITVDFSTPMDNETNFYDNF